MTVSLTKIPLKFILTYMTSPILHVLNRTVSSFTLSPNFATLSYFYLYASLTFFLPWGGEGFFLYLVPLKTLYMFRITTEAAESR
jgi:hypothetical protein